MGAPYEINVSGTAAETFSWTEKVELPAGTLIADYAFEYSVECKFVLTEDDGITVSIDPDSANIANVTFSRPQGTFCAGQYPHGCRLRHLATDALIQWFDGNITLTTGNFP